MTSSVADDRTHQTMGQGICQWAAQKVRAETDLGPHVVQTQPEGQTKGI